MNDTPWGSAVLLCASPFCSKAGQTFFFVLNFQEFSAILLESVGGLTEAVTGPWTPAHTLWRAVTIQASPCPFG